MLSAYTFDVYFPADVEPFTFNLLFIFNAFPTRRVGDHHRRQRKLLNPVFSTAHMRNMVPLFNRVCLQLQTAISKRVSTEPVELDILSWMGRTALELIGQAGLGHSFDPLVADAPDEFAKIVKSIGCVVLTLRLCATRRPFCPRSTHVQFSL